jgi:aminoglycoside phosphotransferase (APT) family kinase protein
VSSEPDNTAVEAIARRHGGSIARIDRFKNGLCHFVYDVTDLRGRRFVLRIARRGNEPLLAGALHWHPLLVACGVPVAGILAADATGTEYGFAYLVLERLAGADLEDSYPELPPGARHSLGTRMAAIQQAVTALPGASRYGEALSHASPGPADRWAEVVESTLSVCRARAGARSALRTAEVERLERAAGGLGSVFAQVPRTAFLDDTTTKNVMVTPDGALSGIVDVDTVWFGDPLYALGLTQAAFARRGFDPVYTSAWAAAAVRNEAARQRLSFYTALFAAVLLSEDGLRFNRDQPVRFEAAGVERLRRTIAALPLP